MVEILTTGDVLKRTIAFGAVGPGMVANSEIVAALGGETDFQLRAWFEAGGRRSREPDEITVRKV